jgi:hypothetical protein
MLEGQEVDADLHDLAGVIVSVRNHFGWKARASTPTKALTSARSLASSAFRSARVAVVCVARVTTCTVGGIPASSTVSTSSSIPPAVT